MKKWIFEFKISANSEKQEIILYHPNWNDILFHLKWLKWVYYSIFLKELIKIWKKLSISYQEEKFNKEKIVKELLEKIFIEKDKYSFQEIEIAGLDLDKNGFWKRIQVILKKWSSNNFLHNFSKKEKEYYEKLWQDKLDKSFEKMQISLKSRSSDIKRKFFEKIINELKLIWDTSENSQYLNFETKKWNKILKIKQDLLNNHLIIEVLDISNNSSYKIDFDWKDYFDEININFHLFIDKIKMLIKTD